MRSNRRVGLLVIIGGLVLTACAGTGVAREGAGPTGARQPQRTLVLVNRGEPPSIAAKRVDPGGSLTWGTTLRLANAYLALVDGRGALLPYLAERLPQLDTDTWRVFADGAMETSYRLKPDLTWHDGTPLTAQDFVFSRRVYSTPELGGDTDTTLRLMHEVVAPDSRTLMIRWNTSYPNANDLKANFPPLPRHILENPYREASERGSFDTFIGHRYWNLEYVGAGPFKLDRWEPGAFMEFSAFDGHALGRPKIDRLRLQSMDDANVVLAGLLAGDLHLAADDSIRFQQAVILKREWSSRGNLGTVLMTPTQWRYTYVQLRPDYARPLALQDVRVRRALAHTLDKPGLNEGLFDSEGIPTDTTVPPTSPVFPALDRAITKYPYDPRRAEQLMAEAGWTKGGDGTFAHPTTGRFESEYKVLASVNNESEAAILAAGWRRVGFQIQEAAFSAAQGSDAEARATFMGMHTTSGSSLQYGGGMGNFRSENIPTGQNRWRGNNRSAWSNAEYDRLSVAFTSTLDRAARDDMIVQANRILTEELPVFSLYFNLGTFAHAAALRGPQVPVPDTNFAWDIHTWDWS